MVGFYASLSYERTNPGNALPNVTETMLASTAKDMIPGIDEGLNQLLAKIDGEFNMKTLPTAAKTEPISPKIGY